MCGIAGIVSPSSSTHRVTKATACLTHRGPQSQGIYQNESCTIALGHNRLSILDLSDAARQPFTYHHRYHLVHNGELYNYIELRNELKQKGFSFSTQSDTEVIAAAYAAWGKACLQRFDGAFAFALWDDAAQTLFAARDRFGEKPFYFFYDNEQLVFASEIKGLWQMGAPKEVNEAMLYNYLTLGYTVNPFNAQETFYRHIKKLPAASFLSYSLPGNELSIERYWQAEIAPDTALSEKDAIERFTILLSDSVHKRLRSDVAIGTSLSGGLDSATIVALCAQQASSQYSHQCFTASFEGFEKDETNQASLIAKKFNLKHHIVPVTATDLLQQMDVLMHHQEEPVQSASVLAQWKVYEAAKAAGITVLLDGQGADELLAGYHKYYHWYWQELYAKRQLAASGELQAARALGIIEPFTAKNKAAALFPHFTASLWQGMQARKAARTSFLHPQFTAHNKNHFYYALPPQLTVTGALHYNTFINGLEDLLRYADRNSMAHAVEVRLPFLQHQLAAFLFTLPPQFKIRNGWTKWLLRTAMKDQLPPEIVWRKDKVGFEPPQKAWMQHPQVQERIQAAKELLVTQKILSPVVLKQPVIASGAHEAGNKDWRFWSASYLYA